MNDKFKWFLVGLCVAITSVYVFWFYQLSKTVISDHNAVDGIVNFLNSEIAKSKTESVGKN